MTRFDSTAAAPARGGEVTEQKQTGHRGSRRLALVGLAAVLVVLTGFVGQRLSADGVRLHLLGGVLIRGSFDAQISPLVAIPLALGVVVTAFGPAVATRLRWAVLLLSTTGASAVWAVSLALTKSGFGGNGLTGPLESRFEYLHDVPRVGSLGGLLPSYVGNIPATSGDPWTTHVAGHPPGPLALFALLDSIGLGGAGWAAAVCIGAGLACVPAVLVAVRALHGEQSARSLAPFLVLAPWWLWVATSADALWLGTSAWGIALLCVAGRDNRPLLVASGFLLGSSAFGSYGVALLGLVALAVLRHHRALLRIGWVGLGAALPVLASGLGGFWWWQGLAATSSRVVNGPASIDRPYGYFVVANLGVAALALGPAVIAGPAGRIRAFPLVWSAAAAVMVADVTGLSKGEVERIWLPFFPWIAVAAVLLPRSQHRRWLAAQVLTAIAIQFFIRTEW